jgi:hypothetical protein
MVLLVPGRDDEVALPRRVVRPLDLADGPVAGVDAVALDALGMVHRPLGKGPEIRHASDCRRVEPLELAHCLAHASIGRTYNQYADSALRRDRLERYLDKRRQASVVLVGEAAGYRGARVSGIPFTSERQLTGEGPAEATATIVHRVLAELGVEEDVLLWNVVPTHPGSETSNRRPTREEVEAASPFLEELIRGRVAIAVGRLAASVVEAPYVRHPSHGGAAEFEAGLRRAFATIGRRRASVRRFL